MILITIKLLAAQYISAEINYAKRNTTSINIQLPKKIILTTQELTKSEAKTTITPLQQAHIFNDPTNPQHTEKIKLQLILDLKIISSKNYYSLAYAVSYAI